MTKLLCHSCKQPNNSVKVPADAKQPCRVLHGFGAKMQVLMCDPAGPSDMVTPQLSLHLLHSPDFPTSAAEMVKPDVVVHLSSATAVHRQHVDANR